MEFEEWLIAEVFGKGIVDVHYVGSYRETITSLHYADTSSDIDIMYIYRSFDVYGKYSLPNDANNKEYDGRICTGFNTRVIDADVPGYVYIQLIQPVSQVVNSFKKIVVKGEFHSSLRAERLVEYFEDNVICNVNDVIMAAGQSNPKLNGYFLKSDAFIAMHEEFNRERFAGWMLFQQCGPASKVFWNVAGLPQKVKISPLDMVFVLHSPHWPQQANEWLNRKRKFGFPGKQLINEIKHYGVDIVAKSSDAGMALEWRLSFSIAEVKLVSKWNHTQKSCYRILKTLHTDYLSQLGITSYSIKNIMFNLIESKNPGIWKPKKLVKCIYIVLKSLKSSCRSKYCPHFFIRKNNLFRDIDKRNLKKAIQVCDRLLLDIFGQIWISDGLWFEICAREMDNYYYSLQEGTNMAREAHEIHAQSQPERTRDFSVLFKIYYSVKIHRQVSAMFLNASMSKHYNEKTVFDALHGFIKSENNFNKAFSDFGHNLVYCQAAWAYIKCLHWLNRNESSARPNELHSELSSNDVEFSLATISSLERNLGKNRKENDHRGISEESAFAAMRSLNPNFAQQIKIASQILSGKNVNDIEAQFDEDNESITKDIPVVVCPLDCVSNDKNITDFPYKGLAYYCPCDELIFYGCLQSGRKPSNVTSYTASLKELKSLLKKSSIKQFQPIMYPFAMYLQTKIDSMLEQTSS